MTKKELKFINKFQNEMLLKLNKAFVEILLDICPMSDDYRKPSFQKLLDAMTDKIQPETFVMRACLRQFVVDKYRRLDR